MTGEVALFWEADVLGAWVVGGGLPGVGLGWMLLFILVGFSAAGGDRGAVSDTPQLWVDICQAPAGPQVLCGLLCLSFHICKRKGFSRTLVSHQGSWISESLMKITDVLLMKAYGCM